MMKLLEYVETQVKYIVGTYKFYDNPEKYTEKLPQGRPKKDRAENKQDK